VFRKEDVLFPTWVGDPDLLGTPPRDLGTVVRVSAGDTGQCHGPAPAAQVQQGCSIPVGINQRFVLRAPYLGWELSITFSVPSCPLARSRHAWSRVRIITWGLISLIAIKWVPC